MSGRIATPARGRSSGAARKAAKWLPSAASSTSSSCETAAPEMAGIGGLESASWHMARRYPGSEVARRERADVDDLARVCALDRREQQRRAVDVVVELRRRRRPA